MPILLDDALLTDTLKSLPGWEGGHDRIWREVPVTAEQAAELRREVEVDADAMGHHPAVDERGGVLRFELSTPDTGGVTELDIALAAHISDLVHRVTGQPGIDAVRQGDPVVTVRNGDEDPDPPDRRLPTTTGAGPAALVDQDEVGLDPRVDGPH